MAKPLNSTRMERRLAIVDRDMAVAG
jgi:hypothetical protein